MSRVVAAACSGADQGRWQRSIGTTDGAPLGAIESGNTPLAGVGAAPAVDSSSRRPAIIVAHRAPMHEKSSSEPRREALRSPGPPVRPTARNPANKPSATRNASDPARAATRRGLASLPSACGPGGELIPTAHACLPRTGAAARMKRLANRATAPQKGEGLPKATPAGPKVAFGQERISHGGVGQLGRQQQTNDPRQAPPCFASAGATAA